MHFRKTRHNFPPETTKHAIMLLRLSPLLLLPLLGLVACGGKTTKQDISEDLSSIVVARIHEACDERLRDDMDMDWFDYE